MSTRRALLLIAAVEGLLLAVAFVAPRWKGALWLYSFEGWLFTLAVIAILAFAVRQWRYLPILALQVWGTAWLLYALFRFSIDPDYGHGQIGMSLFYLIPHAVVALLVVGVCKLVPHLERLTLGEGQATGAA
jgi:hypothetical protein